MRRVSLFLTTLVLAALLLAACGGQETTTSVPSTNVPPVTVESTSTSEATVTEAPTTDLTTTPGVPVTGENSPSRVTNLIGSSVCGMGGDQLGTVQDLVFDFDQSMVTYVIVDANSRNIAVPWMSFTMPTGTGTTSAENCLSLTVDDDTFNNAPDFDSSTMPTQGQPATGWDTDIQSYWANPGSGGTGGTGTVSTNTPSAGGVLTTDTPSASGVTTTDTPSAGGAGSTAMPDTTATASTGSSGTGTGQGAQQMQGVMLATDILGATVTVSPQGNDQGTGSGSGTGTGTSTNTPEAGATSAPTSNETATPSAGGTGSGSGTGTGDFSSGSVEDIIIDPSTGDVQYLVVSFGDQTNLIPVPIGFMRWDATTNSIVLMVNQNALQNAPAFSSDQFPDTSTTGWDAEFSTYWQSNGGTGTGSGSGSGSGVTSATATPTP